MQFLDPPEQVEVRVGQQARLHCEFKSSSVPVACCWIYNRDKVKKWVYFICGPSNLHFCNLWLSNVTILSGGGSNPEGIGQQ